MNKKILIGVLLISLFTLVGCGTKRQNNPTSKKVQNEIKVGINSDDVIYILGSPSIITTDNIGREIWIYDDISTSIFDLGSQENHLKNKKNTTVIIKFDKNNKIRDLLFKNSI